MTQETASGMEPVAPPTGKAYWRSLDQLADTPEFRDWVERRFPESMTELLAGGVDRRHFLQLMAASIGLAGLAGCRRPEMHALPYSKSPEEVVPGLPNFYATAMPRRGWALPVLVESHEGRPTKIEGNPRQPDSGGSSDTLAQASVLELYDPDRSGPVLQKGQPASWKDYDFFAAKHYAAIRERKEKGCEFSAKTRLRRRSTCSANTSARSCPRLDGTFTTRFRVPTPTTAAALAFGSPLIPRYQFDQAEIILSLDCDFLGLEEDGTRHHRGFSRGRLGEGKTPTMNRLYVVESQFTITGGMADHRLRLPSSEVRDYTMVLARAVLDGEPVVPPPGSPQAALRQALATYKPSVKIDEPWVREVAADLRAHPGKGIIIAGRRQPAIVHALAFVLNEAVGNIGKTVELRKPPDRPAAGTLQELVQAIDKGEVETLIILGGNPVYTAPADLGLADRIKQVATTIRLGLHADETSALASWHLPAAHYLESWGDARAGDGIVTPHPAADRASLRRSQRARGAGAADEVRDQLTPRDRPPHFPEGQRHADAGFEAAWRKFLHEGTSSAGAYPIEHPALKWDAVARAVVAARPGPGSLSASNMELVLERDAKVDDGRFANNGWLQELSNPITKLSWGNAALLSPRTAQELGITNGDVVRLELEGRSLEAAAMILPGQADYSVGLALGYGRTACGHLGKDVGYNAYALRTSQAPDIALGLKVSKAGRRVTLSCSQDHFTMAGRDVIRESSLAEPASIP